MTPAPAVAEAVRRAAAATRCPFPWAELPRSDNGMLPLVGYGSLMNRESAGRTFRDGSFRGPVIAYGVRRVFDYVMPERVRQRYPEPPDRREYGVLNVWATGRPEDWINGVVTEVSLRDVPALRDRELGYDLVPVACMPYPPTSAQPAIAYILSCPPGCLQTDPTLLPHPGYVELCLKGAREVSEEFAESFLDSSYLANQATSLRNWLYEKTTEEYARGRTRRCT